MAMKMCVFLYLCYEVIAIEGIMIKKECPPDEVHKSCSFHGEYTCWVSEDRQERVKTDAKVLVHCRSGCFCKNGYVREYPDGGCIIASTCRDNRLRDMLARLPKHSLTR